MNRALFDQNLKIMYLASFGGNLESAQLDYIF